MEQSLLRHIEASRGTEAESLTEQAALQEQDRTHIKLLENLMTRLESGHVDTPLIDDLSRMIDLYKKHLTYSLELMKLHKKPDLEEFKALQQARRSVVEQMFVILIKITREYPEHIGIIDEIITLQALENRTN